jgi:predicted AlkP superfamily phosphohydrolase/phosphomutase
MRFFRSRKKAWVIGLDGVPFGLLQTLASRGVMPYTAELIKSGGLRQMRASLPPISSVSWTSFMTGANPAEHGIFGFTEVNPQNYQLRFPTFADVAVPTFWDKLGDKKRRCVIINQPSTYPARPLPGAMVSGFVALGLEKSVWPREHLPALQKMDYRIDVDTVKAREDLDGLLADLEALLETRRKAAIYFGEREAWDYFQVVVTGTDRLHHFLWRAVAQTGDPRHERAMGYYHQVDCFIREIAEQANQGKPSSQEGEDLFLLSDHGFCELKKEVRLNAWLQAEGYLDYLVENPTTVADIGPGTRAFALDPGRIYLNVKGRFGRGTVAPEEAPALRAEIAEKLQALQFEGAPVIARIFTKEEAFHGPKIAQAPGLVLVSHNGFDLKGTTKGKEIFADTHFQGMHTWPDAFVWSRQPVPDNPEIADLAKVICDWLL